MNLSRNFLLVGGVYLIVGMILGSYMGGSGDHSLTPVHAHINLLGFTLMTLFGLSYRVFPALADGWMGVAQFWLHQIGTLVTLLSLYLLLSGKVAEAAIGPVIGISEGLIMLGALIWLANVARAAR
ncbi:hypothetical protein [Neotabrizicola sp. sgz301269]|uniref:hypothetical protein n=1 Tax=Neotabrizicola sp. sgz301269 TaxID=3276282 RepID=UPI00376F97E0